MKYFLILLLFISVTAQAQSRVTYELEVPAGTASFSGPVLDGVDPESELMHWERIIAWTCYHYVQYDVTDPENPVPIPCNTPARQANTIRAMFKAQWAGLRANVERFEKDEKARAIVVGDIPE
jgi:hypothetical protein